MTRLCRIPGCRIRNRHLPGCGDEQCGGCLPRVADEGHVCDVDVRRAEERLAAIIALAPDARLVAAGLVRRGSGGSGGKPGSRPPLNDGATDALDEVTNAITTIAQNIAETRGLQGASARSGVGDPLAVAASWLLGQLEWLRHANDEQGGAYAAAVFPGLGDCASRMRSIVDGGRTPGRYAGPCSHQDADGKTCAEDVVARPGSDVGRCKACGSVYDVDEQQAWMRAEIEDYLARPVEIAGVLLRLGFKVGYSTIAAYATKGQLVAHGRDEQDRPLYRIGDVIDLRVSAQVRRLAHG